MLAAPSPLRVAAQGPGARPCSSSGRSARTTISARAAPSSSSFPRRVVPALPQRAGLAGALTAAGAVQRSSFAAAPARPRGAAPRAGRKASVSAASTMPEGKTQEEKNLTSFYRVTAIHYLLWAWPVHMCDLLSLHLDLAVFRLEGPLQIASMPIRYTDYVDFPYEWQMATIAWCVVLPFIGFGLLRRSKIATALFVALSIGETFLWQSNFFDPSGTIREQTWILLFVIGAWSYLQASATLARGRQA